MGLQITAQRSAILFHIRELGNPIYKAVAGAMLKAKFNILFTVGIFFTSKEHTLFMKWLNSRKPKLVEKPSTVALPKELTELAAAFL